MDCICYSKCRIQFISDDRQTRKLEWSDRSLIELRQSDITDFVLRAIDVDNKKAEIFNIRLRSKNQYLCGKTADSADQIRSDNGIFMLWLNEGTRDQFHASLEACIELVDSDPVEPLDSPASPPVSRNIPEPPKRPLKSDPPKSATNINILEDVHNLGIAIRQGDANRAALLAERLVRMRVRLQASPSNGTEEQPIRIVIKIDSSDENVSQKYEQFDMSVYPSTTMQELRSALQYRIDDLPANYYIFVNGHLAHDNSTMNDLKVENNTLFILFVIPEL